MRKIVYSFFVVFIGFSMVACSNVGKVLDPADKAIDTVEKEKQKSKKVYLEVVRPQAQATIKQIDSTYDLVLGSDTEALDSDTGIQDYLYREIYPNVDEQKQKELEELNKKLVKSYNNFQEIKQELVTIDQKIQNSFQDIDTLVSDSREKLDRLRELNEQAIGIKKQIQEKLNDV